MNADFKKLVSLLCLAIGIASLFGQGQTRLVQFAQCLICEASDHEDSLTRIHKEKPAVVTALHHFASCEGTNLRPDRISAASLYLTPLTTPRASRAPPRLV